jgi:predicted nucleotidyltransferase
MTLLTERARARAQERLRLFDTTRESLREALRAAAPGCEFVLFGSLVHKGRFNPASDVDLAFTHLPAGETEYRLTAELAERLGRRLDLVDLHRCHFRAKIEKEGEAWIG